MILFYKKVNKLKEGFTLIETMIAISIFALSVLALLSILTQGVATTTYAKKKMAATYLAQEGVEYIRNMRDTFILYNAGGSQNGWSLFKNKLINPCQANTDGCYFDDLNAPDYTNLSQPMTHLTVNPCGSSCPALLYDSMTGKYGYTQSVSTVDSGFIRKIQIHVDQANPNSDELKVFSTVYWKQSSGNYNVVFSESLFNWVK